MTPADTRLLQEAYRRECRSLLQYSREAAPYTSLADRPVRDGIQRIAKEESAELDAFSERMDAHRVALPQRRRKGLLQREAAAALLNPNLD